MLNIAVVGCGYWGPNLIRNFNSLSGCTVKIACDLDESRLNHMQSLYPGIKTTNEFDQILNDKDLDAIVIATPVQFHFPMANNCLDAGKPSLLRNPWLHL
jgi:predicted dehydrogenase